MAYREVAMNEVKEVLRLWLEGQGKRWIGRRVGLDPKTVRGYIEAVGRAGVTVEQGVAGLTDERFAAVMADLQPASGRRPHPRRLDPHHQQPRPDE